jgi:hypothetical protein
MIRKLASFRLISLKYPAKLGSLKYAQTPPPSFHTSPLIFSSLLSRNLFAFSDQKPNRNDDPLK